MISKCARVPICQIFFHSYLLSIKRHQQVNNITGPLISVDTYFRRYTIVNPVYGKCLSERAISYVWQPFDSLYTTRSKCVIQSDNIWGFGVYNNHYICSFSKFSATIYHLIRMGCKSAWQSSCGGPFEKLVEVIPKFIRIWISSSNDRRGYSYNENLSSCVLTMTATQRFLYYSSVQYCPKRRNSARS